MVFNGSEESCPNYSDGELDTDYFKFNSELTKSDKSYGKQDFNKTCFNICATNGDDGSPSGPTYIENQSCSPCLDEQGETNNQARGTINYLKNAGRYEMCNSQDEGAGGVKNANNVPIWYIRQQEANLKGLTRDPNTDGGGVAAVQSFSSLLSNLQYDSAFEECVNGVLNTGDDDESIQERISTYESIKEFRKEDISYLKRKLRNIINLKGSEVTGCLNLLNLGKSVCSTGIADKTLMIGSLIFQVIGNDKIDVMHADNDERYKLNKLIDELGPLIPRAVKNIIEISKEYEARVCNVPTNTTLLLERLYMDLYDKETNVTIDLTPNFDLNFNELANTSNFWFFIQKITVLIVMSVLLFMGANFLMVFLSRTQVVTQINDG
jgi:hypothetical protein